VKREKEELAAKHSSEEMLRIKVHSENKTKLAKI
jgi:hypothetical protein